MKITEIHIHPVPPNKGLVAFANLVLEGQLSLASIAVHEKRDGSGYRITYPTKGKGYLFRPIHPPLSKALEQAIIHEVKTVLSQSHARHNCAVAESNRV
jgi:DNA-binding cell septation regulator SpoVG